MTQRTTGKMKGSRKSPTSNERKLYIEFLGIRIATVTLDYAITTLGKNQMNWLFPLTQIPLTKAEKRKAWNAENYRRNRERIIERNIDRRRKQK